MASDRPQRKPGLPPGDQSLCAPPSSSTPPDDPQIALLREYLAAHDRNDARSAIDLARRLRALGFSIVPTGPTNRGGGR